MLSNVNKFSYVMSNVNRENVGVGSVTQLTPDQCLPRPLPTAEFVNQVVIIIEETTDGQPPRNLMIDMQGCVSLSVSSNMICLFKRNHMSHILFSFPAISVTIVSICKSLTNLSQLINTKTFNFIYSHHKHNIFNLRLRQCYNLYNS